MTERELEWLNDRDNHVEHFCRWCDRWENCLGDLGAIFCPSWTQKVQLLDAAEFEAKVAALIAKLYGDRLADVVLKHARLTVEEEMDGQS